MNEPHIPELSEIANSRLAQPGPGDLATLVRFAASMLEQESLDDLLWSMAQRIGALLDFEDCVIYLREGDELRQVAAYGLKNPEGRAIFDAIILPVGRGIVGRVAANGRPELVEDVALDPAYVADHVEGRSELAVPILFQDEVIGVIDSESTEPGHYDQGDQVMLQWIATIAAPRIASARAEQRRAVAQRQLEEATRTLERRVEERTRELSETVRRLEDEVGRRSQVERALQAEKSRAQTILQAIGEGMIATDVRGRVVMLNEAALRIVGVTLVDALGRDIAQVFDTAPVEDRRGDPEDPVPSWASLLEGRTEGTRGLLRRMRRADGSERSVVETASVMRDAEGEPTGLVIVFRDVTEQQKLEDEVRRSQRLESLGALAGGIAHDFNNLLQAIHGNLDLALASEDGSQDRREALEAAEKACQVATTLPNQLLTLARGGAPVKRRGSSLAKVVLDAVDFSMRGSSVGCDLSIPDDLSPVDIDEGQIAQVVQNLVINACQAMDGTGRIVVSARNLPGEVGEGRVDQVELSIEDHGVGIEPQALERIFDPYFTTKADGSGLGLTTSYWIARRHGGSLSVESEPGVGSRFTLRLPASDAAGPAAPATRSQVDPRPGVRVLVMDDEPGILSFAERALRRQGHEVVVTRCGEEAVERLRRSWEAEEAFQLVLLDLTVPGAMGGAEALKRMRATAPEVRAVVMSGYSNNPILAQYEEHGFQAKLQKPFSVDALGEAVAEALAEVPAG